MQLDKLDNDKHGYCEYHQEPRPCEYCDPNRKPPSVNKPGAPLTLGKAPLSTELEREVDKVLIKQTATRERDIVNLCYKLKVEPSLHTTTHINPTTLESHQSATLKLQQLTDQYKKQKDTQFAINFKSKGSIAYWITISPPAPHDILSELQELIEYLKTQAAFDSEYKYSFEWRDHYKVTGCHIHLLLYRRDGKEINKDLRCFQPKHAPKLKEFGINDNNKVAIKIKFIHNDIGIQIIEDYLAGKKQHKKLDKVDNDRELRKMLGVDDIYEN